MVRSERASFVHADTRSAIALISVRCLGRFGALRCLSASPPSKTPSTVVAVVVRFLAAWAGGLWSCARRLRLCEAGVGEKARDGAWRSLTWHTGGGDKAGIDPGVGVSELVAGCGGNDWVGQLRLGASLVCMSASPLSRGVSMLAVAVAVTAVVIVAIWVVMYAPLPSSDRSLNEADGCGCPRTERSSSGSVPASPPA